MQYQLPGLRVLPGQVAKCLMVAGGRVDPCGFANHTPARHRPSSPLTGISVTQGGASAMCIPGPGAVMARVWHADLVNPEKEVDSTIEKGRSALERCERATVIETA
jgi:hypothetical protein